MSNKLIALAALKQRILDDKVTPDLAATATQLVFGDGNQNASLVFIGEAPGKKEDQQGIPFIGAAGKFLNEMLASIGLKREDVYITNIVKYRPPNNRDPLPAEKSAFLPYLESQLEVIQPKLVVTLGRHSLNCFLPDLQIGQVHGQPQKVRLNFKKLSGRQGHYDGDSGSADDAIGASLVILPLFHPAAALYNGGLRQTLVDDFARIPALLKKLENA